MNADPDQATRLKQFNVYRHPVQGYRALHTGWSWPAFLFDWIWAFSGKMWKTGVFVLLAYLVLNAVVALVHNTKCVPGVFPTCSLSVFVAPYAAAVILLWLKAYLGGAGNRLSAETLATRGYQFIGNTLARSGDDAIARACNGELDQAPLTSDGSVTDAQEGAFAFVGGLPRGRGNQIFLLVFAILVPISLALSLRSLEPHSFDGTKLVDKWTETQTFALAEIGNPDAQRLVGRAYQHGDGVPKDAGMAMVWYQRAANNGETTAMMELARRYWQGKSIAKDTPKAIEWYTKAANAGWSPAQNDLGWIYATGEDGVAVNYKEAFRLFRQASDFWHRWDAEGKAKYDFKCDHGCLGLGFLYAKGLGVPKDATKADLYLRQGMKGELIIAPHFGYYFLRNLDAVNLVAQMYFEGDGVPADFNKGLELLRHAVIVGDEPARNALLAGAVLSCKKLLGGSKAYEGCRSQRLSDARGFIAAGDELRRKNQLSDWD